MEKWKEFEDSATKFLNAYFREFSFESFGNSDSTAPDILIQYLNDNYVTYSDVAQSSIAIEIEELILFSFIIEQYQLKNND